MPQFTRKRPQSCSLTAVRFTIVLTPVVIAYSVMYSSLAFSMASVDPMGEIPFGKLEKSVQDAIPKDYPADKIIQFFKG